GRGGRRKDRDDLHENESTYARSATTCTRYATISTRNERICARSATTRTRNERIYPRSERISAGNESDYTGTLRGHKAQARKVLGERGGGQGAARTGSGRFLSLEGPGGRPWG